MNHDPSHPQPWSRRQFVGKVAQGTVLAGAAALAARSRGAERNLFAYDVSRFSKTDPKLIAWEEVSRWVCPAAETRRIAFGPGDVLHVAAGHEIIRRSPEGAVTRLELGGPVECVAVAPDGGMFAGLRDHIQVLDARGNRRASWAVPDKRTWFTSLAATERDVFAADSGNRVILRYDHGGKICGRIGAKNPGRHVDGLIVPSPYLDLVVHPDGLLRVNNPGRHRFEAYTFDGDFEGSWGRPSAAIAGFCGCCNPIGLAVLPDGRMVTCEKGLPRVKVFGVDGQFESVVAGTESFAAAVKACADPSDCTRGGLDAAVDSQGRIHILDRVTAEVRVLRPKGHA